MDQNSFWGSKKLRLSKKHVHKVVVHGASEGLIVASKVVTLQGKFVVENQI